MFKPPELLYNSDQDQDTTEGYVLLMDELCPSPIPVPVSTLARLIKKKLKVIAYSSLLERSGKLEDDQESICPVCLDCIEGRDEVREPCNCSHVFHLKCLDSWVDQAHVTCPTCRSMLFPKKVGAAAMYLLAFQDSLTDEQVSWSSKTIYTYIYGATIPKFLSVCKIIIFFDLIYASWILLSFFLSLSDFQFFISSSTLNYCKAWVTCLFYTKVNYISSQMNWHNIPYQIWK